MALVFACLELIKQVHAFLLRVKPQCTAGNADPPHSPKKPPLSLLPSVAHQPEDDQFHGSSAGPQHFFKDEHAEAYAAYYTAMYLIQDTGESVAVHMNRGFSSDPLSAYIEFWGVMQAIFIQQDAICELHNAVVGSKPQITKDSSWSEIRKIRNACAGHPAKHDFGVPATQRTFMGRNFGTYARIQYERWDATTKQPSHPTFNLEAMIKAYDVEAGGILQTVLDALKRKWK